MTDSPSPTSYDEVPYASFPFPQSHPDRLATIGALLGMSPVDPSRCHVLELGCGSGGNITPLVEQYPESTFLGIDASQHAVATGRELIESAGLRNVELRHEDILKFARGDSRFDYIICHGVYSWVPDAVQEAILDICRNCLTDNGIAYISYNTNPGWRMRGMIRDVMAYHAQFFDGPERQLKEAQGLVDFLARTVPTEGNPYGLLLQNELELLKGKESYYLYHEFLEDVNAPLYFHEFIARAERHELQYLGEADFSSMTARNFPSEVESTLREVSSDTIRMEQYMDFVRNRTFRQTLLCHKSISVSRDIGPERVCNLYAASPARPEASENSEESIRSRRRIKFVRSRASLTTGEPLVKAAVAHLGARWPEAVSLSELLSAARRQLSPGPMIVDVDRIRQEEAVIGISMIRCFDSGVVDLLFGGSRFDLHVGDRPLASAVARHQAKAAGHVTNLRHESIGLSDVQRFLLQRLDGTHDRESLLRHLYEEVQSRSLVVLDQGQEVSSSQRAQVILQKILEENLAELAQRCLLRRQPRPGDPVE